MFGPIRGPWPDDAWKGWWGPNPPYHVPVFVLTHHPRAPLEMEGGTTFHFVTDGIHAALERGEGRGRAAGTCASAAASRRSASTCAPAWSTRSTSRSRRSCSARGEALLAGIDLPALGFERTRHAATANAMHLVMTKRAAAPA